MAFPPHVRRHRSSLEGVIVPSSQPLNLEERDLATRIFGEIMLQFEPSQPTDIGYYPVTLIRLMSVEVSERDEFLSLFFSFIQQYLLDEDDGRIGLGQVLSTLAPFPHLPSEQKDAIKESLVAFAKYLVDNFFLPLKASAGKTPQPTPALSRSTTSEGAIGTPQRVSTLRKSCLIRDRYRCVITRKFDAQEAQIRYKRDRRNTKDDDGKPLLPERDTMAYLEVAHIIPHLLKPLTGEGGDRKLAESKQIAHKILTMFNPGAIHLINGIDIDQPMNALTLIHDLHRLFGNFEIAFEPVSTQPHTYKVDYVESDRMGRVEKLPVTVSLFLTPDQSVDSPSPQLLAIHSAIGRILHLSAAGEYINDYIRDLEEMKDSEVMQDGSTRLDDYVWFRLRETSVY
ncbi:hypothetical protein BDW67DRAFT_169922 [Aspergillus spinulosporus]